jgi:hypothetical protein
MSFPRIALSLATAVVLAAPAFAQTQAVAQGPRQPSSRLMEVTGDGLPDLLVAQPDGSVAVSINRGGGLFEPAEPVLSGADARSLLDVLGPTEHAAGGMPSPDAPPWRGSGLLAVFDFDDCLINESGIDCNENTALLIGVPEGRLVTINAVTITIIMVQGEPVEVEETIHMEFWKEPRAHAPGTGAFDIHARFLEGLEELTFRLAPDAPVFQINEVGGWKLRAHMIDEDTIRVVMPVDTARAFEFESLGIIEEASMEPFGPGHRGAVLTVEVLNYGDIAAEYLVVLEHLPTHVVPPPAQTVVLQAAESAPITFVLRSLQPVIGYETCTVTLMSPSTGRVYDQIQSVEFPTPSVP